MFRDGQDENENNRDKDEEMRAFMGLIGAAESGVPLRPAGRRHAEGFREFRGCHNGGSQAHKGSNHGLDRSSYKGLERMEMHAGARWSKAL